MKHLGPPGYTATAKLLHWVMALPIILLLAFGEQTMGGHNGRFWPTVHASAGFAVMGLVAIRVVWRILNPPPPSSGAAWERTAALMVHALLYFSMIAIPVTGWLAYTEHVRRSLGVAPASFFLLTKIPLLPDFGMDFHFLHRWGGRMAMALIALHILAALKHQFVDRQEALRKMGFSWRKDCTKEN